MPGREAEDMPPSPDSGRNLTYPESGDIDSSSKSAEGEGPAAKAQSADSFSLRHGAGFAAAVLVIMFSEQAFLNAGPLIVRSLQGAAAAGFIFNVLMIARAPLQLFQAVSTSILPHLTSLHTSDRRGQRAGIPPLGADGAARASPPSRPSPRSSCSSPARS